LGTGADRQAAVAALNHAVKFLRNAVATQARLRFTPTLHFVEDPTLERGSRVEAIIRELHAEDDPVPRNEPECDS
jgi:ribosome-binding factor A